MYCRQVMSCPVSRTQLNNNTNSPGAEMVDPALLY